MSTTEILSILTPNGNAEEAPAPDLEPERLREMYRFMVLTRALDDRGMNLQRQGRTGFYLPSRGEEGLQVGCAFGLEKDDWVFPSYRVPGLALARGASLTTMMNQIYGNAEDICKGRQMPVHYSIRDANFVSISSPIGTHLPQAVGVALAMKYRGEKNVVMAFFGDGGTSSDGFHMGMNFGPVFEVPVIFFCQNNQWAISVPIEKQTKSETIAIKARAYGMPGIRVDGNDVLAVHRVVREAAERAREGGGPTLIEAVTFRMGPHSSSDDPARYRPQDDVDKWARKDPIERFRVYLAAHGLWDEEFEERCATGSKEEIAAAVKSAEAVGLPPVETMFEGVFEEMPEELALQRDGLLRLAQSGQLTGKDEGYFPL